MDRAGKLRLTFGGPEVGFGSVTGFSEAMSKSCLVTPLVSLTVDDTFVVETSSQMVYTFQFSRVQPVDWEEEDDNQTADPNLWSNAKWCNYIIAMVNRWQARTNGFKLFYTPDDDNPYIPEINDPGTDAGLNGYIKSLQLDYSEGDNTRITGSMEYHVGTMYVQVEHPDPTTTVERTDFQVLMSNNRTASDSDRTWSMLMGWAKNGSGQYTEYNCIDSYTLSGGPEEPFEKLVLKIPKNRLASVAPDLVGNIVAGRNEIVLNAVGKGRFTVVKCKLSNKTYTVTAYCNAEALRGKSLTTGGTMTPFQWVQHILSEGRYIDDVFADHDRFIYSFQTDIDDMITFSSGTNTWYILQVCAMVLGCKMFFADDRAFMIDFRTPPKAGMTRSDYEWVSHQEVETDEDGNTVLGDDGTPNLVDVWEYVYNSSYELPYRYGMKMESGSSVTADLDLYKYPSSKYVLSGRVTGDVSLGDEGIDSVVNSFTLNYTSVDEDGSSEKVGKTFTMQESVAVFGIKQGSQLSIYELKGRADGSDLGQVFAKNYLDYRCEPQQSVEFTVKEMQRGSSDSVSEDYDMDAHIKWSPLFPQAFSCHSITSTVDEFTVTNETDLEDTSRNPVYQKLMLSSYERAYPDGTSTYRFGVISDIDLSSSISQITSNQNNG